MPRSSEPDDPENTDGASPSAVPEHFIPTLGVSIALDSAQSHAKIMPDLSKFSFGIQRAVELTVSASQISDYIQSAHYARIVPKIKVKFPKFDFPEIDLQLLKKFGEQFARTFALLRNSLPPNWPEHIDFAKVITIVNAEGLPLVWVPRAAIVDCLLAAETRTSRLTILQDHVVEITEDCRSVLNQVTHKSFCGQVELAFKAVDALDSGHCEAAQALAVVVTETAVSRCLTGSYQEVKRTVLFDVEDTPLIELKLKAALAPIGSFYTSWYMDSGQPPPDELSRHVTVHHADIQHYTNANAIIATMLVSSVLRGLQELQEIADAAKDMPM